MSKNWIGTALKSEALPINEDARKEITKCAVHWYGDAAVLNSKKPLFLDKSGNKIVKVLGFTVNMIYEVEDDEA